MMKFYSLALCGMLCALSSISHAKKEREEIDWKMKSLACPPGERPVKLIQAGPDGARNPREKRRTKLKCIKDDPKIFKRRGQERTTQAPHKVEVLDRQVPNIKCPFGSATVTVWSSCVRGTKNSRACKTTTVKCLQLQGFWTDSNPQLPGLTVKGLGDETVPECPFAHRPVKVSPFCPSDATVTPGCPPSKMMACVPEPFGNNPGSLRLLGPEWEMGQSPRTDDQLNFEMAHKACIVGQRPMKMSPWCRTDADDIIDCGHTEVWCVQDSFTPALKSVEELEKETLRMICPRKHDPTLIRGLCPAGSKRTTDCEEFRKACRPEPEEVRVVARNSFSRFNRWNGMEHPKHWSERGGWSGDERGGHGKRSWRTVNNNNGF